MSVPRATVPAGDGLLLVDKPAGLTSHDVVARARRLTATRKVGHAGTLDPMATGLLVLGVGRATRLLTYLVGADKEYRATVRLGQRTVTDDAEGEITAAADARVPIDDLQEALEPLRGPILQRPSAVSAIKVDGRRSYARVRGGEDVDLPARPVTVSVLRPEGAPRTQEVAGATVTDVDLLVRCSSGTYVRALARDLGEALGTGGHLTALRRTEVGPFGLDHARTLPQLAGQVSDGEVPLPLMSLSEAASRAFPVRRLQTDEARAARHGQPLRATGTAGPVAAFAPDGTVLALLTDRDGRARPVLVLAPAGDRPR